MNVPPITDRNRACSGVGVTSFGAMLRSNANDPLSHRLLERIKCDTLHRRKHKIFYALYTAAHFVRLVPLQYNHSATVFLVKKKTIGVDSR